MLQTGHNPFVNCFPRDFVPDANKRENAKRIFMAGVWNLERFWASKSTLEPPSKQKRTQQSTLDVPCRVDQTCSRWQMKHAQQALIEFQIGPFSFIVALHVCSETPSSKPDQESGHKQQAVVKVSVHLSSVDTKVPAFRRKVLIRTFQVDFACLRTTEQREHRQCVSRCFKSICNHLDLLHLSQHVTACKTSRIQGSPSFQPPGKSRSLTRRH